MKQPQLTVNQLLNGIPTDYLDELSDTLHTDLHSKKLTGREVFHLLLLGFFDATPLSWRVLEEHYKGTLFQKKFSPSSECVDHSSLNERLEKMPVEFFEQLFQYIFSLLEKYHTPKDYKRFNIIRFDSTMVGLSAKLLQSGMKGLGDHKNPKPARHQVKFSVGFNGTCAVNAKAFFDQVYFSEDIALSEAISATSFKKDDVLVFDRGLSGKQQLKGIMDRGINFVGRIKENLICVRCDSIAFSIPQAKGDDTVEVIEDCLMNRMENFRKISDIPFRLVICRIKETGEKLRLVTNMLDITALEAAQMYKLRWDIELFFKFLKQHMHFSHLLSRKEHTINIAMYMSLITASMIYVYKKLNEIQGFKIAKLRFRYELTDLLIEVISKINQQNSQTEDNSAGP